ncbi:flagellar basal-body MS-ring/collar protein FliF [Cytobacillus sp. S13-E01]|uniref:flagellar basal-body MS-ring/collar protein FliF n=1 Tax=Cytobacillus sp. S13-E01 TaxID=3031326 RepID=UPI0023D808C9|nr:flagellar basal-body MS-ring/collar protein FliF [Cytobacillus sp. S13-E01]MDF0725190.1 flagellar basal-body MS-ring/collar protein FliF [Cytobacillus sp. S13-E01]
MNEKLTQYKNRIVESWKNRTKSQKGWMIGAAVSVVLVIAIITALTTRSNFVPLYSNLTPQETGQIKATLDSRGIKSELADNGTTIRVPQEVVDTLKVELAAEGIPDSGSIDYSFFSQNAGFGMTDNEFGVLKLEAMQTELANLIKGIEGINDAKVMITLPKENIFVGTQQQAASASIVLNTKPGYKFDQEQITSLYHLVSRSVPDLPTDNIVITNQLFEYFDLENEKNNSVVGNIATQLDVKKEIERDIQRQVQQMLGMMMGPENVVVSVTTDLDFTQENREENIVTPVDVENQEGIEISVERITETFTGNANQAGGIVGAGENEIPNYPADGTAGTGDYERIEERINNEVNRIRKEIVESPYKIRDLGIQVIVDPSSTDNGENLPPETLEEINNILSTIVRTTIDKGSINAELDEETINDKVVVSVQKFQGKPEMAITKETAIIPLWIYFVGGGLLLIIFILLFLYLRKRKPEEIEEVIEEEIEESYIGKVPDVNKERETEASVRRKQLEKMAKDKPEDFAKLLRSWLAED